MATKKVVKAVPDGYNTVSHYLVVRDAAKAIEYYKTAFGAEERLRMPGPGGKGVMHAELKIGDSTVMLSDEQPQSPMRSPEALKGTTAGAMLYVKDVDATFKKALDAGAKATMPVSDMFWGDRYGQLTDPFGHVWSIATHVADLSPAEMEKAANAFYAEMAKGQKK